MDANDTPHRPENLLQAMSAGGPLGEYMLDAMQRTVLFGDVMRRRSDDYYSHKAMSVPHVLSFDAELVLDGRELERPANYLLVRVKRPQVSKQIPKNVRLWWSTRVPGMDQV